MSYFISILVYNIDGEERADCFAQFVYLVSGDCCVALPGGAMGFLQFVTVAFLIILTYY